MSRVKEYIGFVIINGILLTILLAIWTDELELKFNDFVRPFEFIKIIFVSFCSLLGMFFLNYYLNKKEEVTKRKERLYSVLLILLLSSLLYVKYIRKISSKLMNNEVRSGLIEKLNNQIEDEDVFLAYGSSLSDLTYLEYDLITKMNWFPKISSEAKNISYGYGYDGFLPDYYFDLNYNVPLNVEIEEVNIVDEDFEKNRTVTIKDNRKFVSYYEGEY